MVAVSKISRLRTWGLALVFIGMLVMNLGLAGVVFDFGKLGEYAGYFFLIIGLIMVLSSMAIYFYAGMISTSAEVVYCPRCGKATKIVGITDHCMYCHTTLSFDPKYASENPLN